MDGFSKVRKKRRNAYSLLEKNVTFFKIIIIKHPQEA
jgi:hypothetical protein